MATLVAFDLAPDGAATRVRLTHSGFPSEEARAEHEMGWSGSIERLARSVG